MGFVFRVDASIQIGTGHVMRCLTLAHALKLRNAEVRFICREHSGNLISYIQQQGFQVLSLPLVEQTFDLRHLIHAAWLGVTQAQDAEACRVALHGYAADWLIVDHYALDCEWEEALQVYYNNLMVIDDLADRVHICNILLDQTYGREASAYQGKVPDDCQSLLGSQYALLRPEFAQWRDFSLQRRANPVLKNLLVTMGGVDQDNVAGQVLEVLGICELPEDISIIVILGLTSPHVAQIKALARKMPYKTEVKTGVSNMAEIMSHADIAIGAAGATTWERCCLGLPTILMPLAGNQGAILEVLTEKGICESLSLNQLSIFPKKIKHLVANLSSFIEKCSLLTNGQGSDLVVRELYVNT
ncbi:UDP-2,4-diacetamido-2,4,6-trideoxy-beta-L-altropyranose hydrolase [uncultured Paraglaciecola sp.]|uniref:UDP-2,4-diacetamido-2,4, 6-trideoxy-beta-L-altropyranose hydrolase n=1 Tax=uncultured Paraglaciecola sp. TaxID=1765024 RepID=UPI0025E0BBEC|nr:UDP-2,4-diacetamido-2,4,6-trideoxy-beta-L-altropyranose hydrolase [uncultured Paraglaciecola sp.]